MKKLLRKKLALMLANLKKKRPFYTEVEYLEASGTQYINTGLLSTANSKVDVVFGFTSMESGSANNCAIFGGRSNTTYTVNTFTMFKLASASPQSFRFDYNGQRTVATASQLTWDTTSKYRFQYTGSQQITTNVTTGESVSENLAPGSSYTETPITLFGVNTRGAVGQNMPGRIYKCWYTDGTTTLDLIPVLDWNMTPCMYDKVSGELFYNQGTGDFTAGREIHYVDYLETLDNTNWITTTFKPTATTNIETKVRCITTSTTLTTWALGASTWWGVHLKDITQIGIVNGTRADRQAYYPYSVNTDVVLKLDGSNVYVDGNLVGSITKASATSTLDLFRYYNASNLFWRGRIYYFKADDNGTQVLDMVCAIDENGVGFMFDKVSHTCFLNAGTGAFKTPVVELEYLESTGTQYIDTGYSFNSNTDTIELGYQNTSTLTNKWLFGSYESNANIGISSANLSQVTFWYNGNVWGAVSSQYDSEHILRYDSTGMSNDGINLKAFTSYTGTWNLYLFALNNTGTSPNGYFGYGKIWGYTHTRNSSTLVDLIPAFKDGVAGMLDKANNVFYSNAGTGTFTAGKIVESEWE